MKVIDLLSIITDETRVILFKDGEYCAEYNGKDSIPEEYNGFEIKSINSGYYQIDIDI